MAQPKGQPGDHYGRLVLLERIPGRRLRSGKWRRARWRCRCSCGRVTVVITHGLLSGDTRSCGCLSDDRKRRHGHYGSPTYLSWMSAKSRCYRPSTQNFKHYGGRGITMCVRWRESFAAFLADMGPRPKGRSLDRVDVNGNYEPSNCRWATTKEQRRNQRTKEELRHA